MEFPLEYRAELLGEFAERQAAQNRLILFGIAAAIGVFLLLMAAFGSWRLTVLSFVTLPSALVGGLLAAYIGGGVISLGSLVGFFTVLGIAARNGIMLINHYQYGSGVHYDCNLTNGARALPPRWTWGCTDAVMKAVGADLPSCDHGTP